MSGRRAGPPRFYFSLRSPYSWIAYRELVEGHPDVADTVSWVPFWEPDAVSSAMLAERGAEFPYAAMSKAKHLYVLQDVHRLAGNRGLAFTWPVDRDPVWEVPHLGYLVARREDRGRAFVDAAYRARWEQGRDICDRAVVAEVADAAGVDGDRVAGAADDPGLRADGLEVLLDICRTGVFGVPFFVRGVHRYWGVDRMPEFVDAVRAGRTGPPAGEPPVPRTDAVAVGRAADGGHAGGCG